MGWSFGGYAAVMAPIVEPGLYRCAIAAAGYYDVVAQKREADYADVDSLALELKRLYSDDEALLRQQSPLTYIDKLSVPVFIVHGGEDERVPPEQAFKLKAALIKHNKPFEWMFKENEGHGFANETNRQDFYRKSLEFLNRYLR